MRGLLLSGGVSGCCVSWMKIHCPLAFTHSGGVVWLSWRVGGKGLDVNVRIGLEGGLLYAGGHNSRERKKRKKKGRKMRKGWRMLVTMRRGCGGRRGRRRGDVERVDRKRNARRLWKGRRVLVWEQRSKTALQTELAVYIQPSKGTPIKTNKQTPFKTPI
jgi:hypothetical protein